MNFAYETTDEFFYSLNWIDTELVNIRFDIILFNQREKCLNKLSKGCEVLVTTHHQTLTFFVWVSLMSSCFQYMQSILGDLGAQWLCVRFTFDRWETGDGLTCESLPKHSRHQTTQDSCTIAVLVLLGIKILYTDDVSYLNILELSGKSFW